MPWGFAHGSPVFILAELWVTSTSTKAPLQTSWERPVQWVPGYLGARRHALPSAAVGSTKWWAARKAWLLLEKRKAASGCTAWTLLGFPGTAQH